MILGRGKRWWYGVGGVTVAAGLTAGGVVVTAHSGAQPVALRQASLTTGAGAGHYGARRAAIAIAPGGAAGTAKARGATRTTGKTAAAGQAGAAGTSVAAEKSGAAGSTSAATGSCPDVNVVFARGTGEPAGLGIVGTPFASAVASDLPGKTVTDYAVTYAASFDQSSAGPGATDMSNHISSLAAQCPGTQFVVGGYSQGASVTDIALGIRTVLGTGTAIPAADAGRVDAVVVFGNPLKLSGQTIAAASPAYGPKAEEFCNTGDPVCANGNNIAAHLQYATNGDAQQGAQFAATKVAAAGG